MRPAVIRLLILSVAGCALVAHDAAGQGGPGSPTARFFFSGESARGRGLWVYDPSTSQSASVATEEAGEPREISSVGGTVFFRADQGGTQVWFAWNGSTLTALGEVDTNAFDAHLPLAERNLGVVSGDLVWLAIEGELRAFDASGQQVAAVPLEGTQRRLLTDAGGGPAYAGTQSGWSVGSGAYELAEQLFVLHDVPGYGRDSFPTFVVDPRNDIRATAGLQPAGDPLDEGQARTVFFAGNYLSVWTGSTFHADALWRVDLLFRWMSTTEFAPRFVDLNGTGGAVPLAPRALTVVPVTDGQGGTPETLFLFGTDAFGGGRIFAYRFYPLTSGEHVTSSDLIGAPLRGLEIAPWINGVLFSALGEDGMGGLEAVVGTWTDTDGDGAFELAILFSNPGGTIEHLVADGVGNAAWVVDTGDTDALYKYVGGTVTLIATRVGEIDEVQVAGGHLVYRAGSLANPGVPTLFDHNYGTTLPFSTEVPTDEPTGGAIDGFEGAYNNVAIPEALVFRAFAADQGGRRLFATDGQRVSAAGFEALSAGDVLNGAWVGTGRRTDTSEYGLFSINADGALTPLYVPGGMSGAGFEAEVLGNQVLFDISGPFGSRIMLYDAGPGTTSVLLDNHLLGAAEVVGSRVVFSALDRTRMENTDSTPDNDVWDLWTYRDDEGARWRSALPDGRSGAQPVVEWFPDKDFLGDNHRLYWKQFSRVSGVEVFTLDLTAPGAVPVVIDINPGPGSGAVGTEAVFADGRLYWQASVDNSSDTLRLWTTNGTSAVPVSGPDVFGDSEAPGFQLPQDPVKIGNEVFFVARIAGTDRWGVFQVNDDGISASLITPRNFPTIHGLSAIGPDLYFFAPDTVTSVGQMWRITPGVTPATATPQQLTNFPAINGAGDMRDIFLGGDANIYFGRREPDTARQLWVLDVTSPTWARRVTSFNVGSGSRGYAPRHVVAVLDAAAGNTPPLANADSFSGSEDTVITGNVLLNDVDVDGNPLTARLAIAPQHGTVVLNPDGSFTYTPHPDFFGSDSFAYVASDGFIESALAIVSLMVTPVNDPPVGVNDTATTTVGTPVVIDVLVNDLDVDGDALAAGGITLPDNGTLSNVGATITYTPNPGFSGTDTFTYRPFDGQVQGNVTTVRVIVSALPEVAFAPADVGSTPEGGPGPDGRLAFTLQRSGSLALDTVVRFVVQGDVTAEEIYLVGATRIGDGPEGSAGLYEATIAAGLGEWVIEVFAVGDRIPESDERVTLELTQVVSNGALSAITSASGLFLDDDVLPTVAFRSLDVGLALEGTEGESPQGVLFFVVDRSGDLSHPTSVSFEVGGTASPADIAFLTATNGGSLAPVPGEPGRYTLTFDGGAASADIEVFLTADTEIEADETVTLTLVSATGGVLPPAEQRTATGTILDDDAVSVGFAEADAGGVNEGGPGSGGRLAFTLQRSGSLALDTVVRFVVQGDVTAEEIYLVGATRIGDGPPGSAGLYEATIAAGASERVIEVFAVGDRIPEADETVTLDLVEVVANGTLAGITSASGVFLNDDVLPTVAFRALDAGTTLEGTSGTTPQGVLSFVVERSGDLSYPTAVTFEIGGTASPGDIAFLAATNGGSLAPVPGEPGRYTLTFDGGAASADIEVYVTADAEQEAPETVTLTLVSAFDGRLPDPAARTATGTILDDDAPPPPPALAFREADAGRAPEGTPGVSAPGRLVFVVTRTGELSVATTVTFELGGTASADDYWVSPVVAGGRIAAVPGEFGRHVLTFDAGAAEAEIELLMVPDAALEADETVTVTLLSATGGTLPAADARTATGTILDDDAPRPNTPPVANDVFFAIDEDTPFIANMFGFTSDPELNQASIAVLGTTNLTVTRFDGGTGEIEVQPLANFFGIATITYQVTDAGGLSDTGVVTLTVVPVDDPPVGVDDEATTSVGTPVVIDVLGNDSDADDDILTAGAFANVVGGTLSLPGDGAVVFTPTPGFVGLGGFTYRPYDGQAQGNVTTVRVEVTAATPQPRISVRVIGTSGPRAATVVTLEVANIGARTASNVVIDRLALRRLAGRGRILSQTPLPIAVGTLAAGERRVVTVTLAVDPRVQQFAITERGSFVNPAGRTRRFSATQTITP